MQAGDKVKWVVTKRGVRTIDFSTRYGTVLEISGDYARVKLRNNHVRRVALRSLRLENERGALTEMLMGKEQS